MPNLEQYNEKLYLIKNKKNYLRYDVIRYHKILKDNFITIRSNMKFKNAKDFASPDFTKFFYSKENYTPPKTTQDTQDEIKELKLARKQRKTNRKILAKIIPSLLQT